MLEARRPMILAGQAETVEILRPQILPVVEQDAKLKGRLRRTHEIGFVDPQDAVEIDQRRNRRFADPDRSDRSEEHTSELQSLMRISYAVFCLKKKKKKTITLLNLPTQLPNKDT